MVKPPAASITPGREPKSFAIVRETRVSWFDIRQLLATGTKTVAATIVGSMSGRREIMAALDPPGVDMTEPFRYDQNKDQDHDIWIDYLADTGDGWNATTSIAWLVGRDGLKLAKSRTATPQDLPGNCNQELMPKATAEHNVLPAGSITILGGDEVYPTASATTYQRRFIDPFRCARYFQQGGRAVYAIPGNHDWYDGLTGFLRIFCQSMESRRWFGAWQAQQHRSYFSLKLPHGWWLWGVDMALEEDLDPPQYDYFKAQAKNCVAGDRLILCVPNPTWLKIDAKDFQRDPTPHRIADKMNLIMNLATGSEYGAVTPIPLVLTGDLHYYARHEATIGNDKRHYIVCGGGGAFGLGTLQVPEKIQLPDGKYTPRGSTATRKKIYPSAEDSKRLRLGVLKFPFVNRVFSMALAVIGLITFWALASVVRQNTGQGWMSELMQSPFSLCGLWDVLCRSFTAAFSKPGLFIWWLILLAAFIAFAISGKQRGASSKTAGAAGFLHGVLQIAGGIACCWLAAKLTGAVFGGSTSAQWLAVVMVALLLYLYTGFLFGLYLFLGHIAIGLHDQEVFSAQGIEDYKSFLRIKVAEDGLTIYPIGLNKVAQDWKAASGVTLGKPERTGTMGLYQTVDVPANTMRVVDPATPLAPHLIEEPIHIP